MADTSEMKSLLHFIVALLLVSGAGPLKFALGALASVYAVPSDLDSVYGENPVSFMVFLQARLAAR